MNVICPDGGCSVLLSSSCVFYEGASLPFTGILTNDNLETVIQKINTKMQTLGDGAVWGNITGTVTNQTDLLAYLASNYYPLVGNPSGFLTSAVTSVGLVMPSAFTVTNSPVTTTGDLTVTGAGTVSEYIRGDGTLADFPGGGGGSSVSYYLNGSVNQGVISGDTYYQMSRTPVVGAGTNFSIAANGYIAEFITDANDPSLLNIPSGSWNIQCYMNADSAGGTPNFYIELYKYDGASFTLIADSSATPEYITGGASVDLYYTSVAVPATTLAITDRLAIRIYVNNSGKTITLHTEGTHFAQVVTTFSTGITAINSLTAQVQFLTTGTTGTDFNIVSSGSTHTFNIPTASASARGLVSTSAQTFAGDKTFNDNLLMIGNIGWGTLTPSYPISVVKTGSYGIDVSYTPIGGGFTQAGIHSKNNASSGYAAVIEEGDGTTGAQAQNPLLVKHSPTGVIATGVGVGINFQAPDDAGTARQSATTFVSTDAAAATYTQRYSVTLNYLGTPTRRLVLFGNGNLVLGGSITDLGQQLQVNGEAYIGTINNPGVASNAFLVSDSGVVKYRTAAQVLSDIGAQAALVNPVTGTGTTNYVPRWTGSTALGDSVIYNSGSKVAVGHTSADGLLDSRYTDTWSSGNFEALVGVSLPTFNASASLGTVLITGTAASLAATYNGNATIGNGGRTNALDAIATFATPNGGTITVSQASTIRALSAITAATYFNGGASSTITHVATIRTLSDINSGGSNVSITNRYGILVGDLAPAGGSITYTNRWGIYQEGSSDINYFASSILVGTTTNAGYKVDIVGSLRSSLDARINSLTVGRGNYNYLLNAAFGYGALASNVSGTMVTAVGGEALGANTSGSNNTAVGESALGFNTIGGGNTAVGLSALQYNVSGVYSTGIGYLSLQNNKANYNTAIGSQSGLYNSTGTYNTAIGADAIAYVNTGSNNTALGYRAGYGPVNVGQYNQTPSNSLYLGYMTRAAGNGNNANEIVIGASTDGNGSNTVTLGNNSITNTYLKGQVNINTINHLGVAATAILVSDSGTVKYRTPAEILSDAGAISGSGTANYVARWTGTSALGTGLLYDNGTSLVKTIVGGIDRGLYLDFTNNEYSITDYSSLSYGFFMDSSSLHLGNYNDGWGYLSDTGTGVIQIGDIGAVYASQLYIELGNSALNLIGINNTFKSDILFYDSATGGVTYGSSLVQFQIYNNFRL